ncbi:YfdQ family protein [Flavobacterium sp. NRK1]|uniref:YfdQ family protein n=1 Tax=Flavobacterium sp. NRK1 TaxID=2954929 RepID=UPI002092536A|nr:YfdQ family protein [Flavobacterium sp. NRK1]MCO6149085.1 YfdQ family protein [Flavobacterium sp. NRK1]
MSEVLSENEIITDSEGGTKEIIIRRGEALPQLEYNGYTITGMAINAVEEYLKKAGIDPENIPDSFVVYSYESLFLKLRYNDRLGVGDTVEGVLKLHPELSKWKINQAQAYDNHSLARFIKMNRHFFQDKNIAMRLVSELQDVRVKTEKQFETADNRRGDAKESIAQKVIESNIPDSFILNLPIFVGTAPRSVVVEIEINPKDFSCELISPDLKEIIDIETRAIIDEQLELIKKLYPELRIFQQ